jgi:KRAB domain-containing zinc finger protein
MKTKIMKSILLLFRMESDNPWQVDSIQSFWFLKCPECTFDSKKEEIFQDHAIENHPKSWELFSKTLNVYQNVVESDILTQIKTEESEEHILKEENINENFVHENEDFDDNFTNTVELPAIMENCDKATSLENTKPNCEKEFKIREEFSAIKSDTEVQNNQNLSELATKSINYSPFDNLRTNKRGEKFYSCGYCYKKFTTAKLKKHIESVHEKKRPHLCSTCEKSFASKQDLKRHILMVHEKINHKKHLCSQCDSSFFNISGLKVHTDSVHEGKRPFECSLCDSKFTQRGALKLHVESVHENLKRYPCGHCYKKFTTSKDAKRHIRTHTGEKPISCTYCGRNFARSDHLKRHERIVHTGEKSFSCNYCNEKFTQSDQLKAHKRIHVSERVSPYKCEVCDYTCFQKGNFKKHVSLVHEGKKPFKKRKELPFKCEACDSSFSEKSGLKIHIESIHGGKEPCSFCGLRFTHICDLDIHIKGFHEKKKPFVCYECDKYFLLKNTLKRHIESVHKGKKPEPESIKCS